MNSNTLVLGANGQVGKALKKIRPDFEYYDRSAVDLSSQESIDSINWSEFNTVINAAAYTAVDRAEEEPLMARKINSTAVGIIAEKLARTGGTMIHFSSDYVFDGKKEIHDEKELPNPQSVYGETKNQGDVMALANPNSYVIRTSWVIGDGNNFARTMINIANRDIDPNVVNDQYGRPTTAVLLAKFAIYLCDNRPETGIYNLSNDGPVVSWCNLAKKIFEYSGHDSSRVSGVSSSDYFNGKNHAKRPTHSTFNLEKTKGTNFDLPDWRDDLNDYIKKEIEK